MTCHLPKTVGGDAPPWSIHNHHTAWCPLSPFTGLPIKIVQDHADGMKKTSWELFLCTKHGQNRGVSLMVCGMKCQMTMASLEKTKVAGWPHLNVTGKALRSCRSCSGMRKTESETGKHTDWNHPCGGSEIHPWGESQQMWLLIQEMAKTSPNNLGLRARVWQVSINRKQQQDFSWLKSRRWMGQKH